MELVPTHTHAQFYLHQQRRAPDHDPQSGLPEISIISLSKSLQKKKGFISSLCRSNYCALAKPLALEDRRCDIDPHRFFDFDVLAKTLRNHNFKTRTNNLKF